MADAEPPVDRRRRHGRLILLAVLVAAIAALVGPRWLRDRLAADLCPSTVVASGRSESAAWEVTRATCDDGRIVHQLRILPEKGVSTLVYEAEGEPAPLGWSQSGFLGRLRLAGPLPPLGATEIAVPLDPKGRPLRAVRVVAGRIVE